MLTLFSTAKPFRGHIGVIQRNAIRSWQRLDPGVQVILVGDDEGTAQVAEEYGVQHEPTVSRSKTGAPYLKEVFRVARERAVHDNICYLNCDIVLLSDFAAATRRVSTWRKAFLLVGQRTDVDVTEPVDFTNPTWEHTLRERALRTGELKDQWHIDYFLFNRQMYREVPDLLIGRAAWDNWMVWKARSTGAPVVDATPAVLTIHQSHDYSHHPQGRDGVFKSDEALENRRLAGGRDHLYRISDANYRLTSNGVRLNLTFPHFKRRVDNARRTIRRVYREVRAGGLRAQMQR